MKRALRLLTVALATFALVTLVLWFGGRWYLARSVASYTGEVSAPGLSAPVDVSFDGRGVPRIRAKTNADLAFATGYVHASERLFQMELVRRLAKGELAEIFGGAAYETDVTQRQIGFGRKARHDVNELSPEGRATLERYVAGVNAWVAQAEVLPPEFVILRFRPKPWTPEDCLAIALYQSWYSHELMDKDETYQKILVKAGPNAVPAEDAAYPWSPPTLPDNSPMAFLGDERFPMRASAASNSWAIAPSRTESGKAIHASDPHLSIDQAPGLWYLVALHSDEGIDVVGVTQPGLPFVVMGHNKTISFAFTVASVDIIDYFDEELGPGSGFQTLHEEIAVKGEASPRKLDVVVTPRGPIIDTKGNKHTSLHWAGYDFSSARMIDAGLRLQRASTFDEFRGAVTQFGALDANWIYSDRDGNIGYQLGVPVPIREYTDTFAKHPGDAPASAWTGYRSLDETPHALNPAQGWLASCNNQPVGPGFAYQIPGFYDPYRITRASALLAERTGWTREVAERMQLDMVSGRALRWKSLAAAGAGRSGHMDIAEQLRAWDGTVGGDSKAAAIFELWWVSLAKPLFEDDLGDDWRSGRAIQEQVLSGNGSKLVDDKRTPEIEGEEQISTTAMATAIELAEGRSYGEISTLTVKHTLSGVAIVDHWLGLSRGPVPLAGDLGALNANFNSFDEKTGTFHARIGPSMRFVLDWADPEAFTINVALGESGNPLSPHYADFFEPSLRGERWIVPITKEKQDANEASRLRLVP